MILDKIKQAIKGISEFGISENNKDESMNRFIRLINNANLIALASFITYILVYSIVDFQLFRPVIITIILFSPCFILSLFCIKHHYLTIGRLFFQIGITVSILTCTALYLGKDAGVHYFFLVFAVMPIFIWTSKSKFSAYTFFIINSACFVYIEFYGNQSPYLLHIEYASTIRIISILICTITTLFIININQTQIESNEKALEEQKSKLIETNTQLNEIIATKDTLMSIIAHDLRNPLNTILGFSELLYENINIYDKEKIRDTSEIIYNASNNYNALLENLLEWTASQRGMIQLNPKKFLLFRLIEDILSNQNATALKKGIQLENKVLPITNITADYNILQTIIRNLVSNAIKFSNKNGIVSIEAIANDTWVEISVKDNGTGITEDKAKQLFTITKNSSSKGTNGESGTGLGLVLCKNFVEKHGGRIWVESEIGNGSRFYFTIPV